MSPEERTFLYKMDYIAACKKEWIATGTITNMAVGRRETFENVSLDYVVTFFELNLKSAGSVLGLNTRWHISASLKPRNVTFVPKNGQSRRMLQRYEELYTQRELSSGY